MEGLRFLPQFTLCKPVWPSVLNLPRPRLHHHQPRLLSTSCSHGTTICAGFPRRSLSGTRLGSFGGLQCGFMFSHYPCSFPSDETKVSYLIRKLWAELWYGLNLTCLLIHSGFDLMMISGVSKRRNLLTLFLRAIQLEMYWVSSRVVVVWLTNWLTSGQPLLRLDRALQGVFLQSLNETMKDQLISCDEPPFDNWLRENEGEKNYRSHRSLPCILLLSTSSVLPPDPIALCLPSDDLVSLLINQVTYSFQPLVDSSAKQNLIDSELARQLSIPLITLNGRQLLTYHWDTLNI